MPYEDPASPIKPPRLTPEEDSSINLSPRIRLPKEKEEEISQWLGEYIPDQRNRRDSRRPQIDKWMSTLDGKRSEVAIRQGASNLSVPLTLWAEAAIRARLRLGITESKKIATMLPLQPKSLDGVDMNALTADVARFFDLQFRSPRALNGKSVTDRAIKQAVAVGTAAIFVRKTEDAARYVAGPTGDATLYTEKGRVKWEYISRNDLIWVDGFGTDTQSMPLIGYEYDKQWGEITLWAAKDAYDPDALETVIRFYDKKGENLPAKLRPHRIAEVYFDYCLDGAVPTALLADYHIESGTLLRVAYNRTPRGARPIFIVQFDEPPDPLCAEGQGVCAKLEGAQDETDLIHNLGIEAGKRAVAHLIALKSGSGAASELGEGDPVLPGDVVVTEVPKEDVQTIPLGDPASVQVSMALEGWTRNYVTSLLGLDPTAVGDVQAGKRVPASLGLSTQREGRVIVSHALTSFAGAILDATYLTLELFQWYLPEDSLLAAMPPESANNVANLIFTPNDDMRKRLLVSVTAQDAAMVQETRRQELLVVNQLLGTYYDKVITYAQLALSLPEPLRDGLMSILQKMENGIRAMLATVDSIPNPDEVVPATAEIASALRTAGNMMTGGQSAAPPVTTDLGGGAI